MPGAVVRAAHLAQELGQRQQRQAAAGSQSIAQRLALLEVVRGPGDTLRPGRGRSRSRPGHGAVDSRERGLLLGGPLSVDGGAGALAEARPAQRPREGGLLAQRERSRSRSQRSWRSPRLLGAREFLGAHDQARETLGRGGVGSADREDPGEGVHRGGRARLEAHGEGGFERRPQPRPAQVLLDRGDSDSQRRAIHALIIARLRAGLSPASPHTREKLGPVRFSGMGTQTLTLVPETAVPRVSVESRDAGTRKARAGLAMSIATFAMAAASAIQAILYLGKFGTNARTDGFFVAFALYSTFGVFSQSLRVTSVPLLVQPGARLSTGRFAATLLLIAVPVLLVTGPLAGPLAQLIAPGLSAHGRAITAAALPVLGCAMVLQLWAAGGATVLAIRDRFTTIAGAYMSGAAAGLLAFLVLMDHTGVQTLGWSMLTMSVVTSVWMLLGVRRSGGFGLAAPREFSAATVLAAEPSALSLAPAALARDCGVVLGRTAIYLAFNVLFVITLAFGSRSAAGGTTVLSYAYLFVSYLVAGTGMALGMSSIPDLTREARSQQRTLVAAAVPRGFRYAMLIAAPALALLIAAGAPLVHAVLPRSLSAAEAHTLRIFGALLLPWLIAALLVNFLLPVLLALGRARLLGALALPLVALQLAATAIGSALFGVDGAVGAFWVAPSCLAVALLIAAAGRSGAAALARELAGDGLRFLAVAALAFGAGWLVGAALPASEFVQAAVTGVLGGALYLLGLWLIARPQLEVLLGALVTRPAPA